MGLLARADELVARSTVANSQNPTDGPARAQAVGEITIRDGIAIDGSARQNAAPFDGPLESGVVGRILDEAERDWVDPWGEYLIAHRRRFEAMAALMPRPIGEASALDVGAFPVSLAFLDRLGYRTAGTLHNDDRSLATLPESLWERTPAQVMCHFSAERSNIPAADSSFDFAVASEVIEHMPSDPQHLLVEINRVLRRGGQMLVTTPNITSTISIERCLDGRHPQNYYYYSGVGSLDRHHVEYTPELLASLVRAAGFSIVELTTVDVWEPPSERARQMLVDGGYGSSFRGDSIFCLARKETTLVDRTPPTMYDTGSPRLVFSGRNQALTP